MDGGEPQRSIDEVDRGKLPKPCAIWGVLNVTPDSFSDGGQHYAADQAIEWGSALLREGADVIDVGGESSRPAGVTYGAGYEAVDAEEEARRVVPVIEALVTGRGARVSVDTVKPEVARRALRAGAAIVNDIRGGRSAEMLELVAEFGCELVLMHNRGRGEVRSPNTDYRDVVRDVRDELIAAAERAEAAGVARADIWLDPGIGFAKTPAQSLALLEHLPLLREAGHRVLIGTSRKSMIAHFSPNPDGSAPGPLERLGGTAATVAHAVRAGVDAIRVHDVAVMRQTAVMTAALLGAGAAA